MQSEIELAHALMGGDAGAHRVAWNRYAPLVRRIARRAFGQAPDVDDVTQEVFFRLFRGVDGLRKPESLRSFVASFAFRVVRSERRRRRTAKWLELGETGVLAEDRRAAPGLEARSELGRLDKTLSALSTRERNVLLLKRVEGMTLEEIAGVHRLSLATIKRALRRASTKVVALTGAPVRTPAGTPRRRARATRGT